LALRVVRQEIETEELDTKKVEDAKDQVASSAKAIASWVARKADAGAEEFSKQIGKSLGDARVLLASWLMISGQLQALVDALAKLLS
ncbi:MAG: hypothetical protein LPK88_07805, partial [Alphaproteobacteria bacterium]|nr:hypothetical protein [Alphaproteobacteria bacterium]MDX5416204.1 hypothetical protein [Alphaproteobacteria bacterium]MDX5493535.1 hypothetical protein [Alphaproteobacteria bacterium]